MRLLDGQKVVFFGDSITRGFFGSNYIDALRHLFNRNSIDIDFKFINAGRDGDMVGDLLHRVREDVLPHNPNWVVVLVGLNDLFYESMYMTRLSMEGEERKSHALRHMIGHFKDSYSELIDILEDEIENVVLCTTTIIEEDLNPGLQERLALINDAIRSLADMKGCELIELYDAFKDALAELKDEGHNEEYLLTVDGVHLNKQGAEVVAEKMFEFFRNSSISTRKSE